MFAGGVLSWLVLLPLLSILGEYITVPFQPIHPNFANNPATGRPFLLSEMAPAQIWSAYIRYIGAGAVLASGLITLARTLPTIVSSAQGSLKDLSAGACRRDSDANRARHPDDRGARRVAAPRPLPRVLARTADAGQRRWPRS